MVPERESLLTPHVQTETCPRRNLLVVVHRARGYPIKRHRADTLAGQERLSRVKTGHMPVSRPRAPESGKTSPVRIELWTRPHRDHEFMRFDAGWPCDDASVDRGGMCRAGRHFSRGSSTSWPRAHRVARVDSILTAGRSRSPRRGSERSSFSLLSRTCSLHLSTFAPTMLLTSLEHLSTHSSHEDAHD